LGRSGVAWWTHGPGLLPGVKFSPPPVCEVPNVSMRCWIQARSIVGLFAVYASFGSLPVTLVPFVRTPLPRSGRHGSVDCWLPYLVTEKLPRIERSLPTLAAQSNRFRVMLGCAPPAFVSLIHESIPWPLPLPDEMLSKNQSLPWFVASWAKLYVSEALPPLRLSGRFKSASWAVVAKAVP